MASHMVNLNDESFNAIKRIRQLLDNNPSFSKTILYMEENMVNSTDIKINDIFSELHYTLLRHYNGDKKKAEISHLLKEFLTEYLRSEGEEIGFQFMISEDLKTIKGEYDL